MLHVHVLYINISYVLYYIAVNLILVDYFTIKIQYNVGTQRLINEVFTTDSSAVPIGFMSRMYENVFEIGLGYYLLPKQ